LDGCMGKLMHSGRKFRAPGGGIYASRPETVQLGTRKQLCTGDTLV